MVPQLILLKEVLLNAINRRLLSANIQVPYFATISKTFSIELGITSDLVFHPVRPPISLLIISTSMQYLGRLETNIDISLRDNDCDLVTVVFERNTTLLGKLSENVHCLERHDITNAFLETSLNIKIPSLLCRSIILLFPPQKQISIHPISVFTLLS